MTPTSPSVTPDSRHRLLYWGTDLLHDERLIEHLLAYDHDCFDIVGFLVFYNLGIAVAGYHEDNDRAINIFCRGGLWDTMKEQGNLYPTPVILNQSVARE